MLALAVKPLYASARLAALWRHAVSVGSFCEALARSTRFMPPSEALLLGLVHDIGRLALLRHFPAADTFARLCERGLPCVYAEQLLFGDAHAAIGSRVLQAWDFPADLVLAVRHHHDPADTASAGAAALYLAEFWEAPDEDLPSARHLAAAQCRLDCPVDSLINLTRSKGDLSRLLLAA
jgi:HD-like signal output (HDOD) protein